MITIVNDGRAAAVGLFVLLDGRGVRHIKHAFGTLHTNAFESRLNLNTRRIDDLSLVYEFDADLIGAIDTRTSLSRDARAERS